VLLLDEPTEGLQPSMIDQIRKVVVQMKAEGYAIILVEQRIDSVLSIADRITSLKTGGIVKRSRRLMWMATPRSSRNIWVYRPQKTERTCPTLLLSLMYKTTFARAVP